MAVPAISPSPIAAWPSPRYSSAPAHVDGEVGGVAGARLRRVHVAAVLRRRDRAARLQAGRDAEAPEKRVQRDLRRERRVERGERRLVLRAIDRIEPDLLRHRRVEHRRVVRRVERAESRRERPDALVAVHGQVEDLHHERVARLRPLDVERSGQRVVPLDLGQRVARLLDHVAEAVERLRVDDVARLHGRDGRRRCRRRT